MSSILIFITKYLKFVCRFSINSNTGAITTVQPLDYETQRVHYFLVLARDNAVDSRTGTATVTVNVQDVQDSVPIFTETNYAVSVPENNVVSQSILQVVVWHTSLKAYIIQYSIMCLNCLEVEVI